MLVVGTPSRRQLLTVGSVGLAGLSLPRFLQARATSLPRRTGKAESVIFLHLQGSPSHIDLWDPKPDAPAEIRGEFKPITTTAPGVLLTEVLPLLAKQAHRFTLLRSLGVKPRGLANHGAAIYMLLTGHDPTNFSPTGLAVPTSREDLPSVGALVSRYRPAKKGAMSNVALCAAVREGSVSGVGQGAGLLGGAHDPFTMYADPTGPISLEGLTLPPDTTLGRLRARIGLRGGLVQVSKGRADFDGYYGQALSLLSSPATLRAFRLDDEPPPNRERYGRTRFGQSCLLARRLVEAGARFLQVTWPAGSDVEPVPGPDGSWDTHRNNFPMLKNWRCPVFDRALAALIDDLADRGLLDSTLLVAVGEFGRSPKIGSPTTANVGPGGRDHWPSCYTALLAGGGVRGGAFGSSDKLGAYPQTNAAHPYDLIATIYHALGMDLSAQYRDALDRPRGLVEHGGPITGLF